MANALDLLYRAATGLFPTTGQDLKTALGAVSGDDVLDWEVSAWSFSGGVPDPFTNYSDGHVFNMNISFTQGPWAGGGSGRTNIKKTGNVILLEEETGLGPGSTVSSSIVAPATGSTVAVTVQAPSNTGQAPNGTDVWFSGYSEPDVPGHSLEEEVRFTALLTAGSGGSTPSSFKLAYVVDDGPWNPDLEEVFDFNMFRVDNGAAGWEWEWHTNSSYTDLYATGYEWFETGSLPSTVWTFYLRGRPNSSAGWTNVGAVTWTDPR